MAKNNPNKNWRQQVIRKLAGYMSEVEKEDPNTNWYKEAKEFKETLEASPPKDLDSLKQQVQSFVDNKLNPGIVSNFLRPIAATLEYLGYKKPARLRTSLIELNNKIPSNCDIAECKSTQDVPQASNSVLNAQKLTKERVNVPAFPSNSNVTYCSALKKGLSGF